MSIFNGIDAILDKWLGLIGHEDEDDFGSKAKYKSKTAAIALSENGSPFKSQADNNSVAKLISDCLNQLKNNLNALNPDKIEPSNWKWEKSLHLASHNTSQEKTLEKLVAFLLDENWMNQMPVCNGLLGKGGSNACRVDLVHRDESSYNLIELKYSDKDDGGSDNPLFAAMEILRYGLVYLLFRKHQLLTTKSSKDHHIMGATKIQLVVLAPSSWYIYKQRGGSGKTFNFKWLEDALTRGLSQAIQDIPDMEGMRFAFEMMTSEACEKYIILKNAVDQFRLVGLDSESV